MTLRTEGTRIMYGRKLWSSYISGVYGARTTHSLSRSRYPTFSFETPNRRDQACSTTHAHTRKNPYKNAVYTNDSASRKQVLYNKTGHNLNTCVRYLDIAWYASFCSLGVHVRNPPTSSARRSHTLTGFPQSSY